MGDRKKRAPFFSDAFWRGFFGIFAPARPRPRALVPEEAMKKDMDAMASDWAKVGGDIWLAMDRFGRENRKGGEDG